MGGIFYWRVSRCVSLFYVLLLTRFYRTKFHQPALRSATLAEVFIKYGGSARQGFELAGNPLSLSSWEREVPKLLKGIPDVDTFMSDVLGVVPTDDKILKVSSQLISIRPDGNRQPVVMLVSKHITLLLYDKVLRHDYQTFWQYFNQFWNVSQSHGAAGWLWEAHAIHRILRDSDASGSYPLVALTKSYSGSLVVDLPFRSIREHSNTESLAQQLALIEPILDGGDCLFIPGARNQATFDAVSISATIPVSLFQATTAEDGEHCIKATGLDFLWDAMALAKLSVQHPTKSRKWRFIFIVPQRVAHHWVRAQRIEFGGVQQKRDWVNYIEQYVMVLGDNGSTEIAEIMGSSLGKREQDEKTEVMPKRTKAAQVEKDDEAEEADAPKGESKKKAISPRSKRKVKKNGQVAGGSK
jgi:hypothetical protein